MLTSHQPIRGRVDGSVANGSHVNLESLVGGLLALLGAVLLVLSHLHHGERDAGGGERGRWSTRTVTRGHHNTATENIIILVQTQKLLYFNKSSWYMESQKNFPMMFVKVAIFFKNTL